MISMRTMQPDHAIHPDLAVVNVAVKLATDAMLRAQCPDGHWVFELEADATIPAEYVLLERNDFSLNRLGIPKSVGF